MKSEDTFDALADGPVSKKRSASRTRPSQSHFPAQLDDTVRDHFASIPAVEEDTVVHLFGDAAWVTESSLCNKFLAVIRAVGNQSLAKV